MPPRKPLSVGLIAFAFLACTAYSISVHAAETRVAGELFSKITMSDVITETDTPSEGSAASEKSSIGITILGTQSLSKLLVQSDIKHDVQLNSIMLHSLRMSPGLSIRMNTDADSDRINLHLSIRDLSSASAVDGKQLLTLMQTTSQLPNGNLVANQAELILQTWITNQNTTKAMVLEAIDRLAKANDATAALASSIGEPLSKTTAEKKPVKGDAAISAQEISAKTATTAKPSLAGTWSAKTSQTDGWAVRFDKTGTYTLVHTRSGKNTVSKGTYQFDNDTLTLTESTGTKLSGSLRMKSDREFSWSLQNKAGVVSMTLAFKSIQ